jgi:hypothetical protein
MPELLPLTAADCASSTSETTSENQRKSKIPHPATGGQTATIPGITRFSITVHNIDHDLMMRAVRHHTQCPWVLLYIERWLKAPVCMPDGTLIRPEKGTSQGSVVSPVLANLFLHWAFDRWMAEHHSDIPFERYAARFYSFRDCRDNGA